MTYFGPNVEIEISVQLKFCLSFSMVSVVNVGKFDFTCSVSLFLDGEGSSPIVELIERNHSW